MVTGFFSFDIKLSRVILAVTLLLYFTLSVDAQEGPAGTPTPAATGKQPVAQPATPAPQAATVPPPSTPLALSIQALLKEGVHPKLRWGRFSDVQTQLEALYQPSGYLPLWLHDDKPTNQARTVVANLASADDKGLNSSDYDAELLGKWLNSINASSSAPSPQELASFDSALSIALMRYASNLYKGRINPKRVNFALDIEPKNEDLPALLRKIATSANPDKLIGNLEPKLKLYEHLKTALVRYRKLAKEGFDGNINLPVKFKPGDHHADVPKLRKLLALLGDFMEGDAGDASQTYDKNLANAVKNFQLRHGLTADGVIGKTTLTQLNVPLDDRVKQIQLGLERLRWLPEQINGRYILVNIPSFQVFGYHKGSGSEQPDLEMNVIVGEAIDGRTTPVFHSDMTYVNFRPYWNVPYAITLKEYLPILRRNPGYLGSHNMEIVANFSPNASVYAASGGNVEALASGALKLRQKPGSKNALGLVKFAFPNTNNVYLHSTPSQGLFKKTRRDFSHGCIRVEYPVKMAEFVLKDQEEWTREKIEAAMQQDPPKIVTLKTPIPVYILYSTVWADATGRASFYTDIYGHDPILIEQLAKGFPYP
jgi:murein L,D-transpeptidase YcbB/YkuD